MAPASTYKLSLNDALSPAYSSDKKNRMVEIEIISREFHGTPNGTMNLDSIEAFLTSRFHNHSESSLDKTSN